jgi:hypothetical protein
VYARESKNNEKDKNNIAKTEKREREESQKRERDFHNLIFVLTIFEKEINPKVLCHFEHFAKET